MQCFILCPDTEKWVEKRGAAEFFKTDFEVCVWISEETLSGVLDIASQMILGEIQRQSSKIFVVISILHLSHRHDCDFPCFLFMNY